MNFLDKIAESWDRFCEKVSPGFRKVGEVFRKIGRVLGKIGRWIYNLRKVLATIPVGVAAVILGIYNMRHLPPAVGIGMKADGSYYFLLIRELAVLGPIAITALTLLLVFCSKRILTPWAVSVFTLIIPVFLYVTNVFPA